MIDVTNIQRLSLHDGPGIRTTVFLKGCSLHCYWCHNPETIHTGKELERIQEQCIGCGECRRICPSGVYYRMPGCTSCNACAEACPAQALRYVSRSWDQETLVEELLKDAPYFHESGGGLTFSGGEPLLQWRALQNLLPILRRSGVHVAVSTFLDMCRSILSLFPFMWATLKKSVGFGLINPIFGVFLLIPVPPSSVLHRYVVTTVHKYTLSNLGM